MLEALEVSTAARLREAEGELRFWLKELDPDADRRVTRDEFAAALGRWGPILHRKQRKKVNTTTEDDTEVSRR